MNIDDLQKHGVTIMVLCRNYDDGASKLKDINSNTPHLWTATCKPWDVVEVSQSLSNRLVSESGFDLSYNG
jgi:hypothetical protein